MSVVLNRNRNLDFLKGLMIILVIITHSSFAMSYRIDSPFFPVVVDMAVPVFMIFVLWFGCRIFRKQPAGSPS